jgi:peptidoglycan biosynthesis protein MviN/MurJ (putative lipid II flippase)
MASFFRGVVEVITSLMVVELNNVKQQEHKHYKYYHGTSTSSSLLLALPCVVFLVVLSDQERAA